MRGFASAIQATSEALRGDLMQMTTTTKSLAAQNQGISQQLTSTLASIQETQQYTTQATASLKEITTDASQGMKELKSHLLQYQEGLNGHLTGLEKQLAELLEDYGQRVQGQTHARLEQWNCLLYTSPSPRDQRGSRMPSSA